MTVSVAELKSSHYNDCLHNYESNNTILLLHCLEYITFKGPFTPIVRVNAVKFLRDDSDTVLIGVATFFRVTPLFPMRTVSLASSLSCCSTDADTWCKQAFTRKRKCTGL